MVWKASSTDLYKSLPSLGTKSVPSEAKHFLGPIKKWKKEPQTKISEWKKKDERTERLDLDVFLSL